MAKIGIELKWGIIFILALFLWSTMERVLGLHDVNLDLQAKVSPFFAIIAIALYVLALRDKKRNFYEGRMSFKQGFGAGMVVTLIVTLLTPLNQWVIWKYISPDFFENMTAFAVKNGTHTLKEAEDFYNYNTFTVSTTIMALIMGVITSLIVAFFMKSKKHSNIIID